MSDLQRTLSTAREAVMLSKNETDHFEQLHNNTKKELEELQQQYLSSLRAFEISQQSLLTFSDQKEATEQRCNVVEHQLEKTKGELLVMTQRCQLSESKGEALQKTFENTQAQLADFKDDVKLLLGERGSLLLLLQVNCSILIFIFYFVFILLFRWTNKYAGGQSKDE